MRIVKFAVLLASLVLAILAYNGQVKIGQSYAQASGIEAAYVDVALPLGDPNANLWNQIPDTNFNLGPQLTAAGWVHPEPSIRSLSVKAINNGTWIAFRLEWRDETKDEFLYPDSFRDGAAIMLSLQSGVGQCMGTPSAEAVIAHWKSDWQRDIDVAFSDIDVLYPNFWSDWYQYAVGEPPYSLPDISNPEARQFVGGWAVNNPLSNPFKTTPIETLVAEGFGTLTSHQLQHFIGRGVHEDGIWKVVFSRPIAVGSDMDPPWIHGEPIEIGFAVWDGSEGEVGAKKSVSIPTTLLVEGGIPEVGRGEPDEAADSGFPWVILLLIITVMVVIIIVIPQVLRRKR